MGTHLKAKFDLNSMNAALLISAGAFSVILPIPGIMLVMLLLTIVLYFATGNTIVKPTVIPLISLCMLFFVFSFIIVNDNSGALIEYFIKFIFMGFTGLYISQTNFSIENVIKYSCYFSILLLPFFLNTNIAKSEDWGIMMGISYYVIVFIAAIIFYIFIIKKHIIKAFLFWGILLLIYILFFLSFASRGAILSILLFILLFIYIKLEKHRVIVVVTSISLVVLLVLYFIPIIQLISDQATSRGYSIMALNKMLYFLGDDLDNGRAPALDVGIQMFLDSPIIGNGIAAFEARFNEGYVHNLFVEMLLEGGIILTIPFSVIIFWSLQIISCHKVGMMEKYFVAFLISISLVHLMFSETFWRLQYFWFYIGYTLRIHHKYFKKKWQNSLTQLSSPKEIPLIH